MKATAPVRVWRDEVVLPTYGPAAPDPNPMFLEKRVYQGSNGKVYPLPFIDRIATERIDRRWRAVYLENEFLKVMVLPELGGRIHAIEDKTRGYDMIYRQAVIKPALVGLAGPWVSGGIEFNWPQHHRPATFMPVDIEIERAGDGSATVWCSDHDPMARMKGMHGVCLRRGCAWVELKVQVFNRTPLVQTFLWWANAATRVDEAYQSFFPPDVDYVADHARRAISAYPLAQGSYYGVNYGKRGREGIPPEAVPARYVPPHARPASGPQAWPRELPRYRANDLSFYANIPTPCSYMCVGTQGDFVGGYDHRRKAGLVHLANHHIAPGKKQWTWGNHAFGYAWDRNLTEPDGEGEHAPYIELMGGVYTDNQPDFSFLQPGETRAWSQYWYPIQEIGPVHQATLEAAAHLDLGGGRLRLGICVTRAVPRARVRLERAEGSAGAQWRVDLTPGKPFVLDRAQPSRPWRVGHTTLKVLDAAGRELLSYSPKPRRPAPVPPPAREPPAPQDMASADELYLTGLHLDQYRHATRCPTRYWREALRRDPLDARCNDALGMWHLRRGEFDIAESHFRKAIERLTARNANPRDGEPFYNLGLCLRHLGREAEAYAAFYKATWNEAWAGAAYHALAEIDACRHDWAKASDHLDRCARTSGLNLRAIAAQRQGSTRAARSMLKRNRAADPLDWWTRHLLGEPLRCDTQTKLDIALDFARAGLYAEAIQLLTRPGHTPPGDPREWGTAPLVHYYLGWLHEKRGDHRSARASYKRAALQPTDYCFPARLEEIAILQSALSANPKDARAHYYLGNLLYDRRRHSEAIRLWERSAKLDPHFSVVWRNLGIGRFNIQHDPAGARAAYDRALRANPGDARLLYERDQLGKGLGESPARRLARLQRRLELVRQRDDLSVELCALYNQTGRHGQARQLLESRLFQPWEGGEGQALGQHVRTQLALGRQALARGQAETARRHFDTALAAPPNLGEASHLLANQSDIRYELGRALAALGRAREARAQWRAAATFQGDFQEMRVRAFSEMTYYSALAWERLGRKDRARRLLRELLAYGETLARRPATIDYFATSLPTMLLFDDDLQARQKILARFLVAQAHLGLGRRSRARSLLNEVLRLDPSHALAADVLRFETAQETQ